MYASYIVEFEECKIVIDRWLGVLRHYIYVHICSHPTQYFIMPTHIYNVCGWYAVSIEFFALGKEKSPH
jgi:hypothetical protein